VNIGTHGKRYKWVDRWAQVSSSESVKNGWAHPGIVVTKECEVITGDPLDKKMLVFDKDGNLLRSWDSGLTEAHGMTLVEERGVEYLWAADSGSKMVRKGSKYISQKSRKGGVVAKFILDGTKVLSLPRPEIVVYKTGDYQPTSVAVFEERFGGNGDVWVADGYGKSCVHLYDRSGNYIKSIDGTEGNGVHFDCPHGIFIDRRKNEPEIYIADRNNTRVCVYDVEGRYKREFGADLLISPSAFAAKDEFLFVAELDARIAVLDARDSLVCYLGENVSVRNGKDGNGWPNVPESLIETGKFNSPHGIAVDARGNIFVAEWLLGGRVTKLVAQKN